MKTWKKFILGLFIYPFASIHCFSQTNETVKDSITNLLIGEWSWYGSGGGHSWGFGGPEENGYTVNIKIENNPISDSLDYSIFIDDLLNTKGKTLLRAYPGHDSIWKINSVLPFVQTSYIVDPFDPELLIDFQFLSPDSIQFYSVLCGDCYEVYYKRVKPTGIKAFNIPNLSFYPNPATNQITISNPQNIKIKMIEIIDISGGIVKQWNRVEPGVNILKIESVKPGIYLLKMETEFETRAEKLHVW